MFSEFKAFIARGNVLDLAVAVIIGASFGAIVKSLTDHILNPLIGLIFGGIDLSRYFIVLGPVPDGTEHTLAAMYEAKVPVLAYGEFISSVINFLILAFIIFLIVRTANKVLAEVARKEEAEAAPPPPPPGPSEIDLLIEIRDALRK